MQYILSLEGGGTRSQAALLDMAGNPLHIRASTDVNTNFVAYDEARAAVWRAVSGVLDAANVSGEHVTHFVSALIGPKFGPEVFGALIPHATYHYYGERDVVFARAGLYRPHGVAVVAATGATVFGVRADDGRQMSVGGWGTLLGDEGSAYAAGLLGLRAAVRAFERRLDIPTGLVEAVCEHFHVPLATFQRDLVHLAYQKPLSRAEIAGFAAVVARLANAGDSAAARIMSKVAADLTALMLYVARTMFAPAETFDVAAAGGRLNAGEIIVAPLRDALAREFPHARFTIGAEEPAVALGRLMLERLNVPTF
ncbi:MAG TPA: BadF/BadG/BcrA/BcrD ATPase family protein [Anaerolineae bacterium]|nr:BadF/BadG/BcrA/BcrD ATPase family protein [Anaerolineae bacterium]HQI83232.1 BadF/BadG/BcrA/BcrD ATPase family protein [Anaerolineae bacterium]